MTKECPSCNGEMILVDYSGELKWECLKCCKEISLTETEKNDIYQTMDDSRPEKENK